MRIEYTYNHLHAEDYLYYRKPDLIDEITRCINSVDANLYLKVSCDKANLGLIYYDQKALNMEIEKKLGEFGWKELKRSYYVTGDEEVTKQIVKLKNKDEQKNVILENGLEPLPSHNQVDFLKERVAVEVQFGKYFSVAYDLHVKHTFFYIRDEIEVGIEIIPTHRMMLCMDTGVAWYENEVTNIIREGRNNPSVPIYILGIESDDVISTDPCDYTDTELRDILAHSDVDKLKNQMNKEEKIEREKLGKSIKKAEEYNEEYKELKEKGILDDSYQIKRLISKNEKLQDRINEARDKIIDIKDKPSAKLDRIIRIRKAL